MLLAPTGAPSGDMPTMPMPHVRSASAPLRLLIEDTAAKSPRVRELLARISSSDAIVYVELTASPQVPRASTKLVTASPGVRFLRIGINAGVSGLDLAPLLAHELQHAVEIADHADVRDDDAVRRLYEKIGRRGGTDSFETDAALDVEWQVRLECRQYAQAFAARAHHHLTVRPQPGVGAGG
jgi:hypothetical protein